MRVLSFSEPRDYEILYDGLVNSTRGFEAPSETRVLCGILDKMEAVGDPAERGGHATFTLKDGVWVVRLNDVEYKLMQEAIQSVKWNARAAREVDKAITFFLNVPQEDKNDASS